MCDWRQPRARYSCPTHRRSMRRCCSSPNLTPRPAPPLLQPKPAIPQLPRPATNPHPRVSPPPDPSHFWAARLWCLVVGLVFRDDVRRNAAAIADFHSALLRPGPDIGTALPMRGSPPPSPTGSAAYLPCLLCEPADHLIELLAMPLAQVDLIIPAIKAERTSHVLAVRNLFRVVVACERD